MMMGALLYLGASSWRPLWRVERSTGHTAEMPFGSFWEFLDNLPGAVENLSTPRRPETVLTILPTLYLGENICTTLVPLAYGGVLGLAAWYLYQRHHRPRIANHEGRDR